MGQALVYRRSEQEMPARKEEIRHTKEEGVEFQLLTNPLAILENEKHLVSGMRCIKMQLTENVSALERRNVTTIPGSEFDLPCDVVVMAIGNKSNPLIQSTTDGLMVTPKGTILSETGDGRTSKPICLCCG